MASATSTPLPPVDLSPEDRVLQLTIRALISSNIDAENERDMLELILARMVDKENKVIADPDNLVYLVKGLFRVLETDGSEMNNVKSACLCLVNISASGNGLDKINAYLSNENGSYNSEKISKIVQLIDEKTPEITSAVLMMLCNVTREKSFAFNLYEAFLDQSVVMEKLLKMFTTQNEHEKHYDYIAPLFSNLCQLHEVRLWLMLSNHHFIDLLPYLNHDNKIRRSGIIMAIKNCCFELDLHSWLLNEDLDLIPRILLLLAGPEQFDDEDNERLPLDLQYLPDNKERESDPELRLALLEALNQLSATRENRIMIRNQGAYLILRELHKWEPDLLVKLACENVVDILIRTEDEIGTDNYYDLEVPEDLAETFEKMDKAYYNDNDDDD